MKSFYITHFSRHEQYNICLNYFGQIARSTMLDHMESVCLVLYETTKLSFKMVEQLCFSMSNEGEFLLFCILPRVWCFHCSGMTILVDVQQQNIIALICTSLMTYVKHYLSSVCLLQWLVCSGLWPILKIRLLVFLQLSFTNYLYILDNSPLSDVCFGNCFLLLCCLSPYSLDSVVCKGYLLNINDVLLIRCIRKIF